LPHALADALWVRVYYEDTDCTFVRVRRSS
jgi:hypothetical protein